MLNNTFIKIGDKKYNAVIGNTAQYGVLGSGYNLKLFMGQKHAGSVNVIIAGYLKQRWGRNELGEPKLNQNWLKDLIAYLLPYIKITCSLEQIRKNGMLDFSIILSNQNRDDGNVLFFESELNLQEEVEKLIYDGSIEDQKVELEILKYLNLCRENNIKAILAKELPERLIVNQQKINDALEILEDDKKIISINPKQSPKNVKISITPKGRKDLRIMKKQDDETKRNIYNVRGDLIQGSKNSSYGKNSPIIFDSNNFKLINNDVDKLLQQVQSDYKEKDKEEIVGKINNIKLMIDKGKQVIEIIKKLSELIPKLSNYSIVSKLLLDAIKKILNI